MKLIDVKFDVGDRVWVQEYDSFGEPLRLHYAEVLGVIPFAVGASYIMVTYLDGKRKDECIPMEYIKEYCKKENL